MYEPDFFALFFWAIATSLRHQGCHVSVCGRDLAFTSEDEAEGWKVGATWSREITLFQWLLKSFSKPDLWGWAFHPLFLSPLNLALLWLVRSYIMYIYIYLLISISCKGYLTRSSVKNQVSGVDFPEAYWYHCLWQRVLVPLTSFHGGGGRGCEGPAEGVPRFGDKKRHTY